MPAHVVSSFAAIDSPLSEDAVDTSFWHTVSHAVTSAFRHRVANVAHASQFLQMRPPDTLEACDVKGRSEMGLQGKYCSDPLQRGYNVCVTSLPADFAERTGSFCYGDTLNNAVQRKGLHERIDAYDPPPVAAPRIFPMQAIIPTASHRRILLNTEHMYEGMDKNGKWHNIVLTTRNVDGTYEAIVRDDDGDKIADWHHFDPFRVRAYAGEMSLNDEVQFAGGRGKIVRVDPKGLLQVLIQGKSINGKGIVKAFSKKQLKFAGPHLRTTIPLKAGDDVDVVNPADKKRYPAVITQLSPSIKADIYDAQKREWFYGVPIPNRSDIHRIHHVGSMNVCKAHTGQPWCITSHALHKYLDYAESPAQGAAAKMPTTAKQSSNIEIKCDASSDWRSRKLGGTGCWWQKQYVGNSYARAGRDADFLGDGKMTVSQF